MRVEHEKSQEQNSWHKLHFLIHWQYQSSRYLRQLNFGFHCPGRKRGEIRTDFQGGRSPNGSQ